MIKHKETAHHHNQMDFMFFKKEIGFADIKEERVKSNRGDTKVIQFEKYHNQEEYELFREEF